MFKALRGDFQLASMLLFCVAACLIILPFAVYRSLRGDYAIALFDVLVILGLSGAVFHAWRTRRYQAAVLVILFIIVSGSVLITALLGRAGLMWTYPVLLVSFFIAPKRLALAANVLVIVAVFALGRGFVGDFERFSYLATSGLVTLLAFIFAHRAATQREQLEALASYDPLTSAGNRRLMEQDLAQAVAHAGKAQRGRPGIAVLDLDHFKRVNDVHGHDAGDQVLMAFADLVRDCVRKPDRLYRFGGEEFVLLLPGVTLDGLQRALVKVHARVAAGLHAPDGPVTVSIGAGLLAEGEDWPSLLARADAALYRAKHEGRNRVVISQGDDGSGGAGVDRRQANA